jgi:hypothetical protein
MRRKSASVFDLYGQRSDAESTLVLLFIPISSEEIMKTMKSKMGFGQRFAALVKRSGLVVVAVTVLAGQAIAQDEDVLTPPVVDIPTLPGLTPELAPPMQDSPTDASDIAAPPSAPGFDTPVEVKKVNDAVAGWNSAEAGRDFNLGETLRRNWVMLDSEGKLLGQIVGRGMDHAQTEVYFLNEGRMIEKLSANSRGEFVVYGLEEGVYTLLVANEGRYAVNCLLVLENNQMGGPPSTFLVPVSDASPRAVFEQVVTTATKVRFRNYGEFAFTETKDDPARLYGLKGITEHRPETVDATTLGNNFVQLSADGKLIGRLRAVDHVTGRPVDLTVTQVSLLANDQVVKSAQTNRYGVFHFEGVAPGFYTLYASGKDGIAVTSFELMAPAAAAVVQPIVYRPQANMNYLDVTLSPRRDIGWINAYFLDHVPPPRNLPVDDVPYDPYADYGYGYGNMGWGQPHGAYWPSGECGMGCEGCGYGFSGSCGAHGYRVFGRPFSCLRRWKHHHGCHHAGGASACGCETHTEACGCGCVH